MAGGAPQRRAGQQFAAAMTAWRLVWHAIAAWHGQQFQADARDFEKRQCHLAEQAGRGDEMVGGMGH
jgi:hypothetical protein